MKDRNRQIDRLTQFLCALALVVTGFLHPPPRLYTTVPAAQFAEYILPDGTLPYFCDKANLDDEDHRGPLRDHRPCDACVLPATTLPPHSPVIAPPPLRLAGTLAAPMRTKAPAALFRLTAAPRGPPLSTHRIA